MLEFLTEINDWIGAHKELVTVLGVPTITLLVTHLINRATERRAVAERRIERDLQKAIKIADYRRDWIENLRSEFVEILALNLAERPIQKERFDEFDRTFNRMLLLFNPADEEFEPLISQITTMFRAKKNNEDYDVSHLTLNMRGILKKEWDKLKREVSEAEFK